MLMFSKGQKSPLISVTPLPEFTVAVRFKNPQNLTLDATLFGVDHQDQLSDDRFFCFFNQPESPRGALRLLPGQPGELQRFQVNLALLPASVRKLVFTVSIDGNGTLRDLPEGQITLFAGDREVMMFQVISAEFLKEKALIFLEVYFKDQWRIGAVGQGFSGGLSQLLRHYGGVEETPTAPKPRSSAKGWIWRSGCRPTRPVRS
ncbi:TerD family protein [Deinococcus cellulosilyticus]|uniref:TerD domain-containing protein n=1 Tax=Deinococcus cellulosilyticus (strain DSM 18568 / NBRC 106333 / KACC 11606 / 5516J-15) TaxID=1223518 RepID=A0A511N9E6_DEIC1|nr:TerD family protein [Deinococcus cellulosilyticus]GEM49455.1 hypothetical protein DC3_50900 [Deinococcus cellulosilyticus NBRC 106333 = KACC 11606]